MDCIDDYFKQCEFLEQQIAGYEYQKKKIEAKIKKAEGKIDWKSVIKNALPGSVVIMLTDKGFINDPSIIEILKNEVIAFIAAMIFELSLKKLVPEDYELDLEMLPMELYNLQEKIKNSRREIKRITAEALSRGINSSTSDETKTYKKTYDLIK